MIANSLFHFTNITSLGKILESKMFLPGYNYEDVSDLGLYKTTHLAYPMVCFCDIPLKLIDKHALKYGKFGIGLTKEWGIRNDITPILYRTVKSNQSRASIKANQALRNLQRIGDSSTLEPDYNKSNASIISDIQILIESFTTNAIYSKPYEFYHEREWRYVDMNCDIIEIKNYNKSDEKTYINEWNKSYRSSLRVPLRFELSDIKHIIVESSLDVTRLIKKLDRFKHLQLDDRKILIQKIIDLEAIDSDM